MVARVASGAQAARDRIERAGGDPLRVRIVAVTKGFGPEVVAAAVAAGLTDIGENYADELVSKWGTVGRRGDLSLSRRRTEKQGRPAGPHRGLLAGHREGR